LSRSCFPLLSRWLRGGRVGLLLGAPGEDLLDDLEEGMVSVEGEIVQRIYLGTTTQVIVQLAPDVRVVALEQNTARSRTEDRWEIGEHVTLGWHPEHCLVLR
jgi:spermidine/putrescine transport system ATP-binding protein